MLGLQIVCATLLTGVMWLLVCGAALADQIMVDGRPRTFTLHVPAKVAAASAPRPLVVVLHGGGGNGEKMRPWFGMDAVADREGFVVAYPDALGGNWNDGRRAVEARRGAASPDDVAFLATLARTLVARGIALSDHVYVTGASNGGMMTYRLACETASIFAAFAATIANLGEELARSCRPAAPVRMLIMAGTEDRTMPYDGGQVRLLGLNRGVVISATATFHRWRGIGGCAGPSPLVRLADRDPNDGSRVEVVTANGCRAGAAVVLYSVVGGGHQTPNLDGKNWPLLDRLLGARNRDIDGATEIWTFFTKPAP